MRSLKLPTMVFLACCYAGMHFLALGRAESAVTVSFIFLVATPVCAALACAVHARRHGASRARWNALAIGLLLWAAGMLSTGFDELVRASYNISTAPSALLFVLYGVPLVHALASESHEQRLVRAVDLVLAAMLGILFTVHTLAFAGMHGVDEDGLQHLRRMFDVENAFLAVFALIRWVSSEDAAQKRFFGAMARFCFAYLVIAFYINHVDTTEYGDRIDVLIDLPFLLLAVDALRGNRSITRRRISPLLVTIVRTGSPLILPAALLVVSALLVQRNAPLATAGFVMATLGYGVRSVRVQLSATAEREHLDQLARVDALTGLANRRRFDDMVALEWNRSRRNGEWLSLIMVDIDNFKRLNDEWGHQAGDEGIRLVARVLMQCSAGGSGFVARYGGEEFAMIMPGVAPREARNMAEKVRQAVEMCDAISADIRVGLTISAGVSSLHNVGRELSAPLLIRAADEALYEAKRTGRNRVHVAAAFG